MVRFPLVSASVLAVLLCGAAHAVRGAEKPKAFTLPPHNYWEREPKDRFTKFKAEFEAGRVPLDFSSDKAFLTTLLKALEIPASSQMWVYSTTSLQLRFISPRNPRSVYFNEDISVGYIPGGRIEIVGLDPDLGGIFYIFDIPPPNQPPVIERSNRCMNCHAGADTGNVPNWLVESSLPGPSGGSVKSFRQDQTGHGIPFDQRFAGWHVTGKHGIADHWGNLIGRLSPQGVQTEPVPPGERFDVTKYPVPTSDILTHLVFEHQLGFVTRVVEATYRTRSLLHEARGRLTPAQSAELDQHADGLVRYMLFADEVRLPTGGVEGDSAFKDDFLKVRKVSTTGASLRDFDLRTRIFKHRCSYMIHSSVFQGMPQEMKQRVYRRLGQALSEGRPDPGYAYLPVEEKRAIVQILKDTVPDITRR
jgi:hypothetical protein